MWYAVIVGKWKRIRFAAGNKKYAPKKTAPLARTTENPTGFELGQADPPAARVRTRSPLPLPDPHLTAVGHVLRTGMGRPHGAAGPRPALLSSGTGAS